MKRLTRDFGLLIFALVATLLMVLAPPAAAQASGSVEARTTNRAAEANGTVVAPVATAIGVPLVRPYSIPELDWSYAVATGGIGTTVEQDIRTAAGAGLKNYMTTLCLSHTALASQTEFQVRMASSGTVIFRAVLHTAALPLTCTTFANPLSSSANNALKWQLTAAPATGTVYVSAAGFRAP